MQRLRFRTAAYSLLALFIVAIIFQLTVLAGFIPTEMVWGGRLQNEEERTIGAWVSIAFLVLFALFVLLRLGYIGRNMPGLGKWGMWSICALFVLNTVGNLFALDLRETLIFTPVTLIGAVLAARVAMDDEDRMP
ncbi:MAG TPA: hypothetical protein PL070_18740 [Flavobacteriales bacterium]|nr:hypothetical protein [Flavobacteriales bacterium]